MKHTSSAPTPKAALRCELCHEPETAFYMKPGDTCRCIEPSDADPLNLCGGRLRLIDPGTGRIATVRYTTDGRAL